MVSLDGNHLTISEVKAVAVAREPVQMDLHARERMSRTRDSVLNLAAADSPVYAVNTGVGLLANTRLSLSDLDDLQLNVIRSHACGCGPPLPREVVRAMMLIRANVLAKGLSGVRVEVAEGKLKKVFEVANKLNARVALICGDDETAVGDISMKDMGSQVQVQIHRELLVEKVEECLSKYR